jgi:hypothetical protein
MVGREMIMSTVEKLGTAIIALGMVTTLILPGRQTVPVINAVNRLTTRLLGTAMGTAKPA